MNEASHPVKLGGVHHAAYRCKDAKETVEWYGKVLGMTARVDIVKNQQLSWSDLS